MKKIQATLLCVLCTVLWMTAGCTFSDKTSSMSPETVSVLTIGTADSGGTMYPVGKAIADVISSANDQAPASIKVNLSASNGSSSNVWALKNRNIDLGLVSGDIAYSAVHGTGEFEEQPFTELRAVAAVYSSLSNWIAAQTSDIHYVSELKGLKIGVGPQDSTTELSAQILLKTLGINRDNSTLKNCGLGSGATDIKKGELDALHGFAGIPIKGLQELASEIPCTILEYAPDELETILEENSFYYADIIPAGTYTGQDHDIDTFGIKCLLCVRSDMDNQLVYQITETLYENMVSLKDQHTAMGAMMMEGFMYEELPIALHPGAEAYYRESNLIDE